MNANPFFKCWKLHTQNGRQRWLFQLPEEFRNRVTLRHPSAAVIGHEDVDWNSAASQQFLEDMCDAFTFNKHNNPNSADLVYRQQAIGGRTVADTASPLEKGIAFFQQLQSPEGHWPGDYGGPLFLMPGLVVASYFTQTPLPAPHRTLIVRYLVNHQNKDGGWGLHIEGNSSMFGTVMQYVSLRLLGLGAETKVLTRARKWIHENGGAVNTPSWGKFYLALLGVYEWEGCHSLMPEFWLLPKWLPLHPSHYWCHTRMVYLPMGYCYGHKLRCEDSEVLQQLRSELYTTAYEEVPWKKVRHAIAPMDSFSPMSALLKVIYPLLDVYESIHLKSWRKKALHFSRQYIDMEDEHTNYINIGPVNQVINSIAVFHAHGKDSRQFQQHVERWQDYLWVAEDGMKMNGYNGSQFWDVGFATQAMAEAGVDINKDESLQRAYHFAAASQVKEEVRDHRQFFRHDSWGGWPFSTAEHGWPITDCSAEGFKICAKLHPKLPEEKRLVSDDMLRKNIDLLLSFQNEDGGWASYEKQRAGAWLELFNPAEVFGNIMADYSYVECTSSCVNALCKSLEALENYRTAEVQSAIQSGIDFLLKQQRADGSWIGSWAVCFTYGTWFGVEAMNAAAKVFPADERLPKAVERAAQFLLSKQNADGGWGESYLSSVKKRYIAHAQSQVVNTAWALLALLLSAHKNADAVQRGMQQLQQQQLPDGDFPQQGISGVFNFNCMITYTSYRNVFPIWAMARHREVSGGRSAAENTFATR